MRPQIKNLIIVLCVIVLAIVGMLLIAWRQDYANKAIIFIEKNNQLPDAGYYKVRYVYDGDTIAVDMSGGSEKVRLIGVDTPETHDPDVPVQCYGPEASNYTKVNLLDREVRLETDPTNQNRDRYNRLLRYVYLKDGTLWNQRLITEGFGFAYLRYPFTKLENFKETENQAKNLNKGLWSICRPTIINGVYQSNTASASE